MRSPWLVRALSWLAAVLVGGFYGVAGTIAHSVTWGAIPIGLIVASISCLALLIAIRALTHDRASTVAAGIGVLGMAVLVSGPGPGGSVVVPEGPLGIAWIWVIAVSAAVVIAWPNATRFAPLDATAGEAVPSADGSRLDP